MQSPSNQLAESRLRLRHIRQIHAKAIAQIPQKQEEAIARLAQLREQIKAVGVGKNEAAEAEYLQLLHQNNLLENSWSGNAKPEPENDAKLMKAIAYGQLLLDVYGSGVLVKGARADIESVALQLREYPESRSLSEKLLALCK